MSDLDSFLASFDPAEGSDVRTCRECGCTDDEPCVNALLQACRWVENDLCSECDR